MKLLSKLTSISILLILVVACSKKQENSSDIPLIDISGNINNPVDITLSDLGDKITYIPLETTDSSFITDNPRGLNISDKYVIVSNNTFHDTSCLVFDRTTGKFIGNVGHYGQDPQAINNNVPVIDYSKDILVFRGNSDKLIAYHPDGSFYATIPLPVPTRDINSYLFDKNDLIIYDGAGFNSPVRNLLRLSFEGKLIDSLNVIDKTDETPLNNDDIVNTMMIGNTIGTLPGFYLVTELKNHRYRVDFSAFRWMWNFDNVIRFYEAACDTIFDYDNNTLIPRFAVKTGVDYRNMDKKDTDFINYKIPIIRTFFENSETILFMGACGIMYGNFFIGTYDKENQTTKIGNLDPKAGIPNDINGFTPVLISAISEKGEFAGLLTLDKIYAWIEDNPDYKLPEDIAWILDLPEDSNPILVIVSR